MIAVDTNVLVRFLVEDDAGQAARAAALVARATEHDERLYVPELVVCETVWVLGTAYRVARGDVADLLGKLLQSRQLEFQDADLLSRALTAYRRGRGDFADYVIRERARAAGCSAVATFDRALLRESGFQTP
jgi:predicted nucleic-acid-binding protein